MAKLLMPVLIFILVLASFAYGQTPPIEPGVPQELARWRAARYSDVRYKLDLTLEKMSPVLKGTIEVRVVVRDAEKEGRGDAAIILDWRKIRGYEDRSTISNVSVNGRVVSPAFVRSPAFRRPEVNTTDSIGSVEPPKGGTPNTFEESNEHLIFRDGVVAGENVIKLDFTSPILTSGSAITRYIDKEDGSEYIYSLFVPSDASTAFPVFDQPDLKARFTLMIKTPPDWAAIGNNQSSRWENADVSGGIAGPNRGNGFTFSETRPISTYVFAFTAGPWQQVSEPGATAPGSDSRGSVFVRKSQLAKFQPHAAEVFRLNREAIKYFEEYFDYKFPFPKYDLVLIPEFPFGGMEHAGATFLRESSIIFPQEPTKNDHITRATLIFHEAAHQWFGDTVTMRWFDDLWLKEGFATFTAYKAMERIMPEMNAWKVFYERIKQAAYQTDSTKGTTAIYQPIANLSSAKSAYGNIVYNKAPAFLRQAEFYLGEDKFQTAVRAFLKKHEFGNAGWEDLVGEFEDASKLDLKAWARTWVLTPGVPIITPRIQQGGGEVRIGASQKTTTGEAGVWKMATRLWFADKVGKRGTSLLRFEDPPDIAPGAVHADTGAAIHLAFAFLNYQDHGYGLFLLDKKSRDYVLKNIQNEKDPFLRSMMWGALWDSVREGELDPKQYVELVLRVWSPAHGGSTARVRSPAFRRQALGTSGSMGNDGPPKGGTPNAGGTPNEGGTPNKGGTPNASEDESTTAMILNRVSTAMTYYVSDRTRDELGPRLETLLIERMRTAPTLGQRITFYRAFLSIASSESARGVLKEMLRHKSEPGAVATGRPDSGSLVAVRGSESGVTTNPKSKIQNPKWEGFPLKTKDRFDIVTRLLILNDPAAPKLLAELERSETSDDAKRYAYAAKAGIATAGNKAKYWNDFVNNREISESWIEAAFGPFNSIRHADLTLPYLERALKELPNHKRNRKIFFVNGWLGAFIGGQRSEEALAIVNKFLADNPNLDRDLRLKILENVDVIERAVKIRSKYR